MLKRKSLNNIQFFVPENFLGNKKLINIQTGESFPFANDADREKTKDILINGSNKVETKEGK